MNIDDWIGATTEEKHRLMYQAIGESIDSGLPLSPIAVILFRSLAIEAQLTGYGRMRHVDCEVKIAWPP